MSEPNVLLDALIEEAGFSHAGFAARVNERGKQQGIDLHYDHASVARWLRDHAVPRGRVPEMICEILSARLGRVVSLSGAGLDHAGLAVLAETPLPEVVDRAAAFWRSDVKRIKSSEGKTVLNGPAAIAPVFEWENPPDDQDVSSRHGGRTVTSADVLMIQEARARYEQMYRRVGGVPVLPRVIGFLDERAAPLLRDSYDDGSGRQLMRAVGGVVAISGICLYDTDRQAAAPRYFFDALRLAKASGDRGFGGYIVALLANQAMCLGSYRQVVQYAETAMRGARMRLSPALISDLCTLQAKAYARMGDRAECHEQMRRAERMAERVRLSEEPPETGSLSRAGVCHTRGQVHRFATLAMVLAARGELEQGADAAFEMLDRAQGMESRRVRDRVMAVSDAISAHGDSIVAREVSERVKDQFTVPM